MNAAYFAIGCILTVLVIYWGSAATEPTWLLGLFGWGGHRERDKQRAETSTKKTHRW